MAGLAVNMLGDLQVIRDGHCLPLPPSRKTRGLLAFLALNERPLRREQLCELLWEIPDDPRGSLRWSLSKIRKLVDDEERPRILADRSTVAFDTSNVAIDVLDLHSAAEQVEQASVDELVRMAQRNQGAFLEGLDLTDFHDFHAWCIGERERAIRSQARVLRELGKRLAGEPERALDYALSLVSLTPFDESPRAELIRLLVQLDRKQEAEHQYRVGLEKLAEVGDRDSGALRSALRERPRAATPRPVDGAGGRESELVGRRAELAQLRQLLNQLPQASQPQVALIRGEPGMGKSRLLQAAAAAARAADAGLIKAAAFETEAMRPFGVWSDALRRALPDNPASRLLASTEQVSRERIFSNLAEVLLGETERRPLVVLCDDVHWADESSVRAMHYVLRHAAGRPLLVIATSREVELLDNPPLQQVLRALRSDNLLQEIQLQPMPTAEISRLIALLVPAADADSLAGECGGNPLMALELARAGLEGGHSLGDLVAERLAGLSDDTRTIILWASVLGARVNVRSLQQVAELPQQAVDDALEQAEQRGLLHPGERGFRFSHELIRRTVYESISPSRRQAMHRQVAALLEVDAGIDLDLAADLAHHARRSGDPWLAGKAMVSAGHLFLRFFAYEDAMDLYREGMRFADQLGDAQKVCLSLELGEIRMSAQQVDDWQGLAQEFVALAEQAMDHDARAHARLGYQMASYLRWLHGELRGAKRFSLQAERVSRGGSEEAQVLGLAEASKCLAMLERDLSRAEAMALEAKAMAQRVNYECNAVELTFGILRYYENQFDTAVDHLEHARSLAKAQGDRLAEYMANEYLTLVEMERRDCEAAHDYACALVELGERLREGSERPFAAALRALCHYGLTGDAQQLQGPIEELRIADAKQRLAYVLNRAAVQHLEHQLPEQALECAREALQLSRTMERPTEMLQACISLENLHRNHPDRSPDSYRNEIERLLQDSVALWARQRADALLG